jgi:hypothetical protein
LTQPVRIVATPASGQPDDQKYTVKPSLTTLLEDFHVRGDNKRLILAKVEIKLSK